MGKRKAILSGISYFYFLHLLIDRGESDKALLGIGETSTVL